MQCSYVVSKVLFLAAFDFTSDEREHGSRVFYN